MKNVFNLQSIAINFQPGEKDKRPFIFVHGNTQNDTCGQGLMEYFSRQGHTVLSYDLPGHGHSKLDTTNYVFSDLIELNQQIINHHQLTSPILCGHSLGGMIQAGTIARFKIADANLILCGSYDSNPMLAAKESQSNEEELMKQSIEQYIFDGERLFEQQLKYDYFANRYQEDSVIESINRRHTQPAANSINLKTINNFSARKRLIEMQIPILVLHGKKETVISRSLIELMALEYDDLRLAWYDEYGHNAFYQQAELTNIYLDKYYQFIT